LPFWRSYMNKEKEEIMEDKDKHEDLIKEINDSKILAQPESQYC